uniref:Galectin n=1 Tax=Panagrellus redivivus TaxID=6233 RepID=A0A7E4VXI4_PANRE
MFTVSALTVAFSMLLAAFVEADDKVYPFVANQSCPHKAWTADPFGFHESDAPNAPLRPAGTSPFILRLPDRLYAGQTIFIDGKTAENPILISFNLLAGTTDVSDNNGEVAMHWTQQYTYGLGFVTVKINGQWDPNVLQIGLLPANKEFKIALRVLEDSFEIFKEGVRFDFFAHKVPIDIIDHIEIIGDVEINALRVVGRHFPFPFRTKFHGTNLMLNDRIRIEGRSCSWFLFSILDAKKEVAFQWFVNISAKKTTRNAVVNGTWGQNEKDGPWYFPPEGYIFVLEIVNEEEHLSLMVNGNAFATFKHRVPNPKEDYVFFEYTDEEFDVLTLEVCSD